MPWPAHNYVEFGGRRSDGTNEIWQCGIRVAKQEANGETVPWGQETFDGVTVDELVVDGYARTVWNWFRHPDSCIAPACRLEWVSSTWITPSGRPDPEFSYKHFYTDPAPYVPAGPHYGGGSPGIVLPFQAAVVVSWTSHDKTHGPGSRGRIYSPAPTVLIDPQTGLFSIDQAQGIADKAWYLAFWLQHGNRPTGDLRVPCIVSPAGPGHRARIDTVTVDTRVDVLRKRADWQSPARAIREVDWGIPGNPPTIPPWE